MTIQLDTSGTLSANYVNGETHVVNPSILSSFGLLFLNNGPFFGANLVVRFTPAIAGPTLTLKLGIDYSMTLQLVGFGNTYATQVFAAISLLNPDLTGTITVSYQALGGNWTYDHNQITNYLNTNPFDANIQYVVLTPSPAIYIPGSAATPFPLNSVLAVQQAQASFSSVSLGVTYYPIGSMAPEVDHVNVGQSQLVTVLNQLVILLSTAPLQPGNNHIGSVSLDGLTNPLPVRVVNDSLTNPTPNNYISSVTPIVTPSSAYLANQVVGGLLSFSTNEPNYSGLLEAIRIKTTSSQVTTYRLYLFSQRPVSTTWTDHAAANINAADLPYLIGSWDVLSLDNSLGGVTINQLDNVGAVVSTTGTVLFGVLLCDGMPTYATASDLTVAISFKK